MMQHFFDMASRINFVFDLGGFPTNESAKAPAYGGKVDTRRILYSLLMSPRGTGKAAEEGFHHGSDEVSIVIKFLG